MHANNFAQPHATNHYCANTKYFSQDLFRERSVEIYNIRNRTLRGT